MPLTLGERSKRPTPGRKKILLGAIVAGVLLVAAGASLWFYSGRSSDAGVSLRCRIVYGDGTCKFYKAVHMPLESEADAKDAIALCEAAGTRRAECLDLVAWRLSGRGSALPDRLAERACEGIRESDLKAECLEEIERHES